MHVLYSAYEPEVTALLNEIVTPGMAVYVIGAHIGVHALYLARLVGKKGIVYAFEPWPRNFDQLRRNVALNANEVGPIEPLPYAVSADDGPVSMAEGSTDGRHHIARNGEPESIVVAGVSIDNFRSEGRRPPDLMLVDVEGEEVAALRGAACTLRECRPALVLEHHGNERRRELTGWLDAAGYSVSPAGARHLYAVMRARAAARIGA